MLVYTFTEARRGFSTLLDRASRDGAVRIRRRDGRVFVLKPEHAVISPFDVPAINLKLERDEIVRIVRHCRTFFMKVNA